MVVRRKEAVSGCVVFKSLSDTKTLPEFSWGRENFYLLFFAGKIVKFYDATAVSRISELKAEYLSVFSGLLETVSGRLIIRLGFNNGNQKIAGIAQKIVCPLLLTALYLASGDNDTAVGKSPLLREGVRVVVPPSFVEFWNDEFSACVSFVEHALLSIGFKGLFFL